MGTRIDNVQPEEMRKYADKLNGLIEDWDSCVDDIYTLQEELDSMWSGDANDQFNKNWAEYRVKFKELQAQLEAYYAAIPAAASGYVQADDTARDAIRAAR